MGRYLSVSKKKKKKLGLRILYTDSEVENIDSNENICN